MVSIICEGDIRKLTNNDKQPHCDMFSVKEACPECGNEDNETIGVCDLCGCRWEDNAEKTVISHGKLAYKRSENAKD